MWVEHFVPEETISFVNSLVKTRLAVSHKSLIRFENFPLGCAFDDSGYFQMPLLTEVSAFGKLHEIHKKEVPVLRAPPFQQRFFIENTILLRITDETEMCGSVIAEPVLQI